MLSAGLEGACEIHVGSLTNYIGCFGVDCKSDACGCENFIFSPVLAFAVFGAFSLAHVVPTLYKK